MHLIEIFLPLFDNKGQRQEQQLFDDVRRELAEKFGGLTAHSRAPAEGLWKNEGDKTRRDDIVILEVMAESVDEAWWRTYRQQLEARFRQEAIVVRAQEIRLL